MTDELGTRGKIVTVAILASLAVAFGWVMGGVAVGVMAESRGECPVVVSSEGMASLERENERLRLRVGSQSAQILQLDKLLKEATE